MPQPKSVLVTGASSGLGRGLALHYARSGATVRALARRKDLLQSLAAEAPPGSILPVLLDVTDIDALAAAVRAAGELDLVIANAGTGAQTPARTMDWKLVRRILDLNVTAACVTLAVALPRMVERGAGHLVAVSSLAAFRGLPGYAAYCASKAAVHTFMESVRVDLRGTRVRATAIHPGFVKTELTAKNEFPMPFLMELDDAVRVMTRGIARGKRTIAFPLPMAVAARAMALVPGAIYEPLAARGLR